MINYNAELYNYLLDTLRRGTEAVEKSIPVYVEQVLEYKEFTSIFGIILSLIIVALSVVLFVIFYKRFLKMKKENTWIDSIFDCPLESVFIIGSLSLFAIFISYLLSNIYTLVMINKAPLIFLLKYTMNLGGS
jgi:Kef-type K+ transport system membrane component KefB